MRRIRDKERTSISFFLISRKFFLILAIFCILFFSSGCTDTNNSFGSDTKPSEVSSNVKDKIDSDIATATSTVSDSGNKAELIEVTDLSQIDEALNKGPVVLKLGSKECNPCKEQEKVFSELLQAYQNSASFMLIDVNDYPDLAMTFEVINIPDTFIIVGKEDGNYIYAKPDGSKTSDRMSARFIGVTDKEDLSKTLDKAIESWKTKE
jgi:thiol-disulfide isomerase/thioredoxin